MSAWIKLGLTVATPLFSDDSDSTNPKARPTGIRVPSIRGQLRYWFRTLAIAHGLTDTALWQREEAVFGSTHRPSPIALRIDDPPSLKPANPTPKWAAPSEKPFSGRHYLLGQGLWDGGLTRGYLDRGTKFTLQVKLSSDDDLNTLFFYSLWAWLTFGGLGARIRRGFGQLRIDSIDNFPDCSWFETDLQTIPDSIEGWQQLAADPTPESASYLRTDIWGTDLTPPQTCPELPALTPLWWGGRILPARKSDKLDNFGAAFDHAGATWRRFLLRGPLTYTDAAGRQRLNSSPEWKAVLVGDDDRFPRGALGLPIGYYRKAATGFPAFSSTVNADNGRMRRASPVWLRPVELTPGRWSVFTHAFHSRLLPPGTPVTAGGSAGGKRLQITDEMVTKAITAWLTDNVTPTPRIPGNYFA